MQSLWSRTIQIKSTCRCPPCLTTQTLLSRRTTTAAARRRIRYGDFITVFYSSMFATALVVDGKVKDARRTELNASLKKAKEELKALEDDQENRLRALAHAKDERLKAEEMQRKGTESVKEGIQSPPRSEEVPPRKEMSEERMAIKGFGPTAVGEMIDGDIENENLSTFIARYLEKQACGLVTHSKPIELHTYQGEILTSKVSQVSSSQPWRELPDIEKYIRLCLIGRPVDFVLGLPASEVWTTRTKSYLYENEMLRLQVVVRKLVYALLLQSLDMSSPQKSTSGHSESETQPHNEVGKRDQIKWLKKQIKMLDVRLHSGLDAIFTSPEALPKYDMKTGNECKKHEIDATNLNQTLKDIFASNTNLGTVVPEICHCLVMSPTPPDTHTFNLLITYLTTNHGFRMVRTVIDFMRLCCFRPNELTVSAVLNFYIVTNNPIGFRLCLDRLNIRGLAGVFDKPLSRTKFRSRVNIAAQESDIYLYRGEPSWKITAQANWHVYQSLIEGCLEFGDIKQALAEYLAMIRMRWDPKPPVLLALLRYCVREKDWELGEAVWSDMRVYDRILGATFYWMLQLCVVCDKSAEFEAVLGEGVDRQVLPPLLRPDDFALNEEELMSIMRKSRLVRNLSINVRFWRKSRPPTRALRLPETAPNLMVLLDGQLTQIRWQRYPDRFLPQIKQADNGEHEELADR